MSIVTVLGLGLDWARIAQHFGFYHHAKGSSQPAQLWVEYGDPTPLAQAPGRANSKRRVCDDKLRPSAGSGVWSCVDWSPLDRQSIGARALARPPGPCSHERVNQATHTWECWSNVDLRPLVLNAPAGTKILFGDIRGTGFCVREGRRRGHWHCTEWGVRMHGYRVVQVLDSGGPCTARVADQVTGAWACRRTFS